ncbi:PfaB family protein [Shewanella sp.]|uniref:PfaB family protein n=1 Tax=Shewanella sp. TaxID=50422 RepID=UPI003562C1DF
MEQESPPKSLRLALCQLGTKGKEYLRFTEAEPDWEAVTAAAATQVVALGDHDLVLMPALDAARARLHPLALLQGLGVGQNAIHQALTQAGRAPAEAEILFEAPSLEAVIAHARLLAGRTHPVYGGYWSHPRYQARVLALVGKQTLVLTQGSARTELGLNGADLPWLLPLALPGNDWSSVQRSLNQIQAELAKVKSDTALALLVDEAINAMTPGCRALVLVGTDAGALAAEAAALSWRLAESQRDDIELSTPAGSVYTPSPAGPDGLAFVYPGVGTASSQMLASMHLRFPAAFDSLDEDCRSHGLSGLDGVLLPMVLDEKPSLAELAVAGVGASVLMSHILEQELAIKPAMVLGYSMGEAAMVAAQGLWQNPFAMVAETLSSPLFNEDISGQLNAVRQQWQLRKDARVNWKSLVLRLPAAEIRPHLTDYPKVAIAISQGPSTVLAGDEAELKKLAKTLSKRGLDTKLVTAMHTPAAKHIESKLRDFYQRPTTEVSALPVMFSAGTQTLECNSVAIADAIAATFTNELKFDELLVRAYKAGGRIFAEVGAGREASAIVQAIGDHKLLRLSAQPSDGHQGKALQKLLARLIAHGIPMNLSRLRPVNMPAQPTAQETTP